ncbi:MAG: GntR family transcriptional regulator [Lentisphaeria bacterium]|nr:GntR family transcriptional regulator [Lentisphaeria bacterium]
MQSKTAFVEKFLLDRIRSGEFSPGSKIPSQHQLMYQCKCSRITVQRALKILIGNGYLHTGKGSGTFVLPGPYGSVLREVIVICNEPVRNWKPFSDVLPDIVPTRWVDINFAMRNYETFFVPGQAVIWPAAQEAHVMLMQYLKSRGIAQLLINRTFENLDHITLDSVASLSEGLSWLQIEAGREIAFISHLPHYSRPYLTERIIAFYDACIATKAILAPERIFKRDFADPEKVFAEMGRELFDTGKPPRGICVLHMDLVPGTVKCAAGYGLTLGKDYFILTFDNVPQLSEHPGLAMMIQPKYRFRHGVEQWLNNLRAGKNEPFALRIKTELRINQKPNQ